MTHNRGSAALRHATVLLLVLGLAQGPARAATVALIAYDNDTRGQVYVDDGSDVRALGFEGRPRWSPDGSRVMAFHADGGAGSQGRGTLVVYDVDTREEVMRRAMQLRSPCWVSDDQIVATTPTTDQLITVDIPSGTQKAVDSNAGDYWDIVDCSPAGRILYMIIGFHPTYFVEWRIADLNTGDTVVVQTPVESHWHAYFSPDGSQIVVEDEVGIGLLSANGREYRIVEPFEDRFLYDPMWVPDGGRIVYTRGVNDVRTMDLDGNVLTSVPMAISDEFAVRLLDVAPDGEHVVFGTYRPIEGGGVGPTYIGSTQTGAVLQLVPSDDSVQTAEFAPGPPPAPPALAPLPYHTRPTAGAG